jgi:hypothetical protein
MVKKQDSQGPYAEDRDFQACTGQTESGWYLFPDRVNSDAHATGVRRSAGCYRFVVHGEGRFTPAA